MPYLETFGFFIAVRMTILFFWDMTLHRSHKYYSFGCNKQFQKKIHTTHESLFIVHDYMSYYYGIWGDTKSVWNWHFVVRRYLQDQQEQYLFYWSSYITFRLQQQCKNVSARILLRPCFVSDLLHGNITVATFKCS
jgi:hypothetical protein